MVARAVALVAGPLDHGERLDRVLAQHPDLAGVSRSALARYCDEGRVTLRGAPARPSAKVRAGDAITVEIPPAAPSTAVPEDIPLAIVYEDRAVLVVDKPAGLVVHPARGHASGTLVNAVLFHADVEDTEDALRPGIVHRIDKDTSGLLVIAKTPAARDGLVAQFKAHTTERTYVALTQGVPPAKVTYDTLYNRHATDRLRFTARVKEGKRAVTHVRVEEVLAGGAAARVECALETGRTHQIRVHLSEAGFPLLADTYYGRRSSDARVQAVASALGRQALHAATLGFRHPTTGETLRFSSPLPDDMVRALAALRALG